MLIPSTGSSVHRIRLVFSECFSKLNRKADSLVLLELLRAIPAGFFCLAVHLENPPMLVIVAPKPCSALQSVEHCRYCFDSSPHAAVSSDVELEEYRADNAQKRIRNHDFLGGEKRVSLASR